MKKTHGFYFWERMGIEQLLYNLEEMKFKNSWSKIFEIKLVGIHFEAVYLKIKSLQVTFKVDKCKFKDDHDVHDGNSKMRCSFCSVKL
jgi:hypothetical protein